MITPEPFPADMTPAAMAERLVEVIEHCRRLGLRVVDAREGCLTLELPYSADIVGNPETGIIHGGALTTLMDSCCGFAVPLTLGRLAVCPTLDLRIDYMTAAAPHRPVFGRAEVYRVTDHVVFARGIAFQQPGEQIIAHCVATFMRMRPNLDTGSASPGEVSP